MNAVSSPSRHPVHRCARPLQRQLVTCVLVLAAGLMPGLAQAAAGLLLTGYGAQSAGMAGVDIVVVSDTTALLHNPAGLAHLRGAALDIYLEPYYTFDNAHNDAYGPKRNIENRAGAVFGAGFAMPIADTDLVAGIGLFAQGGTGWVYDDLPTAFGNRDDAMSIFGVVKLTPGIAWRVSEQLRLGATLGVSYGQARQKLFPQTSAFDANNPGDPTKTFFGSRYDSGQALGFNGRVGLQYEPNEQWTLALTYASKTPLDLKNGTLRVNYDAIGVGRATYRDVTQDGLAFSAELGLGASYRISPRWLLASEFVWLDQSNALTSIKLRARDTDNVAAPQEIANDQALDAGDQYVYGVALEHQYDERTVLRAGFTWNKCPLPKRTLSPLLATINEELVAVGFAREFGQHWSLSGALEYQVPNQMTYTNPTLPFGTEAVDFNEAMLLTLMVSRRW